MGAGLLTGQPDTVDVTSVTWDEMRTKWEMIDDLMAGTAVMRARGERWLPMAPRETRKQYEIRLNRSFLFNALRDTVEKLVSKPMSRDVNVEGDDDEKLAGIADDVDRQGTNLTAFASAAFTSAVKYGLVHLLVDFPPTTATMQGVPDPTLADERSQNIRPFFVMVEAPRLIGWKTEFVHGKKQLTEIRVQETHTEPVHGATGDRKVEYIRVITWTNWTMYRYDEEAKTFSKHAEGTHTFGGIPLVTVYIDQKKGQLSADPPLEDLAWMNVSHWQSASDHRNILRFASVGFLFGKGFDEDEMPVISIGPNTFIKTTNPEADLKYVEYSGAGGAIGAGRTNLQDIEAKMELLGLQPMLTRQSGGQTATGRAIDEGRTESAIQSWIRRLENGLVQCYEMAARWVNVTLPDDFSIDIFNDFGITVQGATDAAILKDARAAGDITQGTYLKEMKRRGILNEALDVETEIAATENETMAKVTEAAMALGAAVDEDEDEDIDDEDIEDAEDEDDATDRE